jgi:hypothetical protein
MAGSGPVPTASGPTIARPVAWFSSRVPPSTEVVPKYWLSTVAAYTTVPGPTTSRLNGLGLAGTESTIGAVKVRVSPAAAVPIEASLPRKSGVAQTLLPFAPFSAPSPPKPGPLIVTTSFVIVWPPDTWRVAPLVTVVPSRPSCPMVT